MLPLNRGGRIERFDCIEKIEVCRFLHYKDIFVIVQFSN